MEAAIVTGNIRVFTTNNRGFTPEELAEQALGRLLVISEHAPSYVKEQAEAFKDELRVVLVLYMKRAVQSERTTMAAKLNAAGFPELVELLNRG